jgi:Ras-related protein Rab-32
MSEQQEFIYKILVVGNVAVGKTSLIKRYVHGIFSTSYKTTVKKIYNFFR